MKKTVALLLCACLFLSLALPAAAAADAANTAGAVSYKITNPYAEVTDLLGNGENHYKTNLHTHSTVSDGRVTMPEMVTEHYAQNYDILAMAEHGVIGKPWNEAPTHYWLMRVCTFFNALSDGKDYYKRQYDTLTDAEYKGITEGTYGFDENQQFTLTPQGNFAETSNRTYGRGMHCVTSGIELSAASVMQSHLCGYFCEWGGGISGMLTHEGDYEYFVKNVDAAGGVTVINHPGHYLNCKRIPENAKDPDQLFYFADIFNRYDSCLGIETFNNSDNESRNNRLFWDELLQYVIPYGKRNVFGFSNSDTHDLNRVDTEFMDYILPAYSEANLRTAMENGAFFATGRLAKTDAELVDGFKAQGPVPQVTSLTVDDVNDIITVTAANAARIEWVANGNVIETAVSQNEKGETVSTIKLREHSEAITCYVRFQIFGAGGYCYSNPFICDDGDMARFIIEDTRSAADIAADKADRLFTQNIFGALIKIIEWSVENDKA